MSYAYRKRPAVPARGDAVPTAAWNAGAVRRIPTSAFPGVMDGGMGREKLEQAMRAKMGSMFGQRWENQAAEAEADRIGGQFSGASGVEDLKTRMGDALGADFSGVRFHTGAEAAAMAAAAHARAFATGSDIYLGGPFDAAIAAHEMVHTVQQGAVQAAAPVMSAPAGAVQCNSVPPGLDDEDLLSFDQKILSLNSPSRTGKWGMPGGPYGSSQPRYDPRTPSISAPPRPADPEPSALGEFVSSIGRSISETASEAKENVVNAHREAVDQYNNHQDDYQDMSRGDRFLWFVQNPIAWVRGGGEDSLRDTAERNKAKEAEREKAARLASVWRKKENEGALGDAGGMQLPGTPADAEKTEETAPENSGAAPDSGTLQNVMGIAGTVTGDWGTGTGVNVIGLPAEAVKTYNAGKNVKDAWKANTPALKKEALGRDLTPSKAARVMDKVGSGVSLAHNAVTAVQDFSDAVDSSREGDSLGTTVNAVNGVSDVAGAAGEVCHSHKSDSAA